MYVLYYYKINIILEYRLMIINKKYFVVWDNEPLVPIKNNNKVACINFIRMRLINNI